MAQTAKPEDFARELSRRFNVVPPVDLPDFASKIGLKIREVEPEGFEGSLIRADKRPGGVIAVNRNTRERTRKRFTIAHEMGHFILPGHGEVACICLSSDVESWSKELPEEEKDANRFASELLMPARYVSRIVREKTATIEAAKKISSDFDVSLTAAAVRCIDLTSEDCALVVSDAEIIKWCWPAPEFQHFIQVGVRVSDESWARKLFAGADSREKDGAVPADTWLSGFSARQIEAVWEDSILLPFYDRVLSIITITR